MAFLGTLPHLGGWKRWGIRKGVLLPCLEDRAKCCARHFCRKVQKLHQFPTHAEGSCVGQITRESKVLSWHWCSLWAVLSAALLAFLSAVLTVQIAFHTTSQQGVLTGLTAWHEMSPYLLPPSHDTDNHVNFPEAAGDPGWGEMALSKVQHPEAPGLSADPGGKW